MQKSKFSSHHVWRIVYIVMIFMKPISVIYCSQDIIQYLHSIWWNMYQRAHEPIFQHADDQFDEICTKEHMNQYFNMQTNTVEQYVKKYNPPPPPGPQTFKIDLYDRNSLIRSLDINSFFSESYNFFIPYHLIMIGESIKE